MWSQRFKSQKFRLTTATIDAAGIQHFAMTIYCWKLQASADPVRCYKKFWLGPEKNAEFSRSQLRHSGSVATSDQRWLEATFSESDSSAVTKFFNPFPETDPKFFQIWNPLALFIFGSNRSLHGLVQWFSNCFWSRAICVSLTVITYHLVPGKVNVPNIIRSKVWKTRIDTNATWTKWLREILMAIFRKQQGK